MKRTVSVGLVLIMLFSVIFNGCTIKHSADYSDTENWAYLEKEDDAKTADVFFICPTVYSGTDSLFNMELTDAKTKSDFLGATNMEKGIYDTDCRFFAPYYRQAGLNVYKLPKDERESYFEIAYEDVKTAFNFYMTNYNNNRPLILAGFSQGADMCIRLMKDCFKDKDTAELLVACYAIGWSVSQDEVQQYPQLKMASGETDTGVIITFNSESVDVKSSLIVAEGEKTFAINPLNWKTDSTPADKSLNKGACFTDYDGKITKEVPNLTGAYIDSSRGTLKVPDVSVSDYPAVLDIFEDGIYHLYDYQFFYRNLQYNVTKRISAYIINQTKGSTYQ